MARPGKETLTSYVGETSTHTLTTIDADGTAVNCSALTLEVIIERMDRTDVTTVANANITKTSTTVSFSVSESFHKHDQQWQWALRRTDTGAVIMYGPYVVEHAPHLDEG